MKICPKCGSKTFYAHQRVYMDIVVDGDNNFERNLHDNAEEAIYESETPYGPYVCTECMAEYDSLDDLEEEKTAPVADEKKYMFVYRCTYVAGEKTSIQSGPYGREELLQNWNARLLDIAKMLNADDRHLALDALDKPEEGIWGIVADFGTISLEVLETKE